MTDAVEKMLLGVVFLEIAATSEMLPKRKSSSLPYCAKQLPCRNYTERS